MSKVNTMLDQMALELKKLSPEKLVELVRQSGLTSEVASQSAFLESMIRTNYQTLPTEVNPSSAYNMTFSFNVCIDADMKAILSFLTKAA